MAKITLTNTEWYEVEVPEGDYWYEDLVELIEQHKKQCLSWLVSVMTADTCFIVTVKSWGQRLALVVGVIVVEHVGR